MITCQHEWIEQCQIKYRWEPLPEGEHWEDAHYPEPECRNGTETVRLWSRDHAVHGVLQSIGLGYPCLHGYRCNTDRALIEENYPEYLKLFEQELFKLRQLAGQVGGKITAESGKLEEARSKIDPEKLQEARIKTGLKNVENGFFTPGHPNCILTFDSQSAAGTIGGTVTYKTGVGLFDKEKKEERKKLGIGEYSPENLNRQGELAREVSQWMMENGLGIFSEEEREKARQRGKEYAEKKIGLFAEENLGKGAKVCKEKGIGLWGIPLETRQQNGNLAMAYRYEDPDHPELGQRAAPVLVRMQKKRGYPHGPENRIRTK